MSASATSSAEVPGDELSAGLMGAAVAVTCWGAGSVITKGIDMGGLAVAVYRFWLYSALILIWMRARRTPFRLAILRDSMWGGIALGLDVALFFTAEKKKATSSPRAMPPHMEARTARRLSGAPRHHIHSTIGTK